MNTFFDSIKNFGQITLNSNNYCFKKCPENIKEDRKYKISGKNNNILTVTGQNSDKGTICENAFKESKIYKWKIKILKA